MHHVKNARACMHIIIIIICVDCELEYSYLHTLDLLAAGKDRRYFRRTRTTRRNYATAEFKIPRTNVRSFA